MTTDFERVQLPGDRPRLVEFLCSDEWPFHGRRNLTDDDVDAIDFASADVASFWVVDGRQIVGLIRLLDLGDIGDGAPLFDVRIAAEHRRRGLGKQATRWLVEYLFATYPELHRIEANTRADNIAMQRVLSDAGFSHEGTLRQAWGSDTGRWHDAMIYGLLRTVRTRQA